jgi:hydrogenase maturation protease
VHLLRDPLSETADREPVNTGTAKLLIIGLGNAYRSDDGIGISIVHRLRELVPSEIMTLEETGVGTDLMESWKGAAAVIVVDAVQSGAPPGTIYRLDAHAGQIPKHLFHYSTHGFSVAEAIELARALDLLPRHLIVYGIEGKSFAAGVGLSIEVEQAGATVVARVLDEWRTSCCGRPRFESLWRVS